MNFWRTLEIYSDHQARRYEQAGVPLERIDSTSFMPGKTSTIYRRAMQEWKGSLILMLARGGWIDTTYGNLELLSDQDVTWFACVQSLFLHLQSEGRIKTFGGIPWCSADLRIWRTRCGRQCLCLGKSSAECGEDPDAAALADTKTSGAGATAFS